jgi:hypothetical protein
MTGQSSYQPFLIGEGKSSTGLFSYLDSWVKPGDAFDEMINAYVYRGSLYQRNGMALFPSLPGNGSLVYQDNILADTGDGGTTYGGTLTNIPIIGTVTITALTAAGKLSSTATAAGTGTIDWSTGLAVASPGGGGIDFATGIWTIVTSSAVAAGIPIMIQYNYVPNRLTTPINNPIMGITTFINQDNDEKSIVILDTRRASIYNANTASFEPIERMQVVIFTGDGVALTVPLYQMGFTFQAPYTLALAPYSLTLEVLDLTGTVDPAYTTTDVPTTTTRGQWAPAANIAPVANEIHYDDGSVSVTFTGALPTGYTVRVTSSLSGGYFTGDNTNFFNWTNWRPSEDFTGYLYLTNNKDRITLFDGTNLSRPALGTTVADVNAYINDILTCLDIKVFQQRILLFRPTVRNRNIPDAQAIYYNAAFNPDIFEQGLYSPFDFAQDISGHGGAISAPTGDWIQSAEFLRDAIDVEFTDSSWLFKFTGNQQDPFRFVKMNDSRSTNAPYAGVSYDATTTNMGSKGLIECDGVTVKRYDFEVIDLWEEINQDRFFMCFAQKFDSLNQTWMLYPSEETDSQTSDSVMVYNFLEDTWTKFVPNLGQLVQTPVTQNTLSVVGLGFTTKDLTWADFGPTGRYANYTWAQFNEAWDANIMQNLSPLLLGGDQNGFVYELNVGPVDNAGPAQNLPIPTSVTTKQFNPFVTEGMKARFGYLDVYYEVNAEVQIAFNFYLNGSDKAIQTNLITLDSTNPDMNTAWKRIYINLTAQFIQWEISTKIGETGNPPVPVYNTNGNFKILGQILHATPAGRLTPGKFI